MDVHRYTPIFIEFGRNGRNFSPIFGIRGIATSNLSPAILSSFLEGKQR
jgi:hypothetical protein